MQHDGWEGEALRLCDRYLREVVLEFALCPWAEPALRSGRVARQVCWSARPTEADCQGFLDRLRSGGATAAGAAFDVGLLIFPRHSDGWMAFDGFAERVRRADRNQAVAQPRAPAEAEAEAGTAPGTAASGAPSFMVAAFHPQGAETFRGPNQLVSFLRRTPDPTLQFVRADLLDRLKESQPDLSSAIGRMNHDALMRDDAHHRLDAVVRAIHADRQASYQRWSADWSAGLDSP